MKYVEASRFGGPEVLAVIEKETPKPEEGMLPVEVQATGINYADVQKMLWNCNVTSPLR
jgi:NADPH2:quinone reductase